MFNNELDEGTMIAGFCRDSASVIREFQTALPGSESTNNPDNYCSINANSPYKSDCDDLTDLKM